MENKVGVTEGFEMVYNCLGGGVVWKHGLVDVGEADYEDVLEVAREKAMAGCEVHILPTLPKDHPLRNSVFLHAKGTKCPDVKIDGRYTEIKAPTGKLHKQKISHCIRKAFGQANEVIIRLHSHVSIELLGQIAKGRFLTHRKLVLIEFKMEGNYISFKRSDFI